MESRVRTVATLAEAGEFALFPLDANKLHIIAGALRIGNYRSAGLYLDAIIWHEENQMHMPVSAALRRAAKTLTKAALRGLPGSRLKQAFDLDELAQLVVYDAADEPFDVTRVEHAVDVVVVATWFMLREIEMAGAKVKDMIVTTTTVSLDIPLHKTAQGGQTELTRRTFRCVCVSAAHPLCPRCAARRHHRRIMATTAGRPDDFLFPTGPGIQRTKAESAEMFRMVLDAAGFQTRFVDEHGRSRLIFGGHAARRGRRHFPGGERSRRGHHSTPRQVGVDGSRALCAAGTTGSGGGHPGPSAVGDQFDTADCGRGPVTAAPLALADGHVRADTADSRPGAPGGPAAGIPAVDFSAPEPMLSSFPRRRRCRSTGLLKAPHRRSS